MATKDNVFWKELNQLATSNSIVIDRYEGGTHPRYPEVIYPLDYGYLENTTAGDGNGFDIWIGSSSKKVLTGILCTFDTLT
jgi:inorganic pyrophosphatase